LEPAKPAIAGSVVCSASVTRGYDPRMPRTLRALKGIHGSLRVPADKSYAHRAFLLAALAEGASRVRGDIEAGDVQRSRALIEALGVSVRTDGAGGAADEASRGHGAEWQIEAAGPAALRSPLRPIDCGRSGTTIRLAAGLLVGAGVGAVLDADPQLRRRPMGRILDPLRRMGAKIQEHEARAPLQLEGAQALRGIEFENTLGSAQVKGALLLAGLGAEGRTVIHESRVSRRHTEAMLEEMGAQVQRQGGTTSIEGRGPSLAPLDVTLPGDPSSAAPWILLATLVPGSELELRDLLWAEERNGFARILQRMGAELDVRETRRVFGEPVVDLCVRSAQLRGIDVTRDEVPSAIDELPLLALAMCVADGESILSGAEELRVKESDRIASSTRLLRDYGAELDEKPDGWQCPGGARLHGTEIEAAGDHRIAMLGTVASSIASSESLLRDVDCVADSYAGFWRDYERISSGW
jgi:3-phosphoshikimate 1-carboxyvinyltransferase